MARRAYIISGAPFHVENIAGKICVYNAGTGAIVKDGISIKEAKSLCDILNEAYSDGYQDCDLKHQKAKEKAT